MKKLLVLLLVVAANAFPLNAADNPPAISINQALKIAQDYLKENGSGSGRYVAALTLESVSLRSSKQYWYARWSSPVTGGEKPEQGLRIEMDGSLARVVSGGAVPGLGKQRYGARDMK